MDEVETFKNKKYGGFIIAINNQTYKIGLIDQGLAIDINTLKL